MTTANDHAPLSVACVRALVDKQYDKRKAAASEIEKMVKEFVTVNNTLQMRKLLKVLGSDLTTSQNIHYRKGGLIGLAAVAVALGKDSSEYTEALIRPILTIFSDNDSRVLYFACEAMYNVVKVARGAVLPYFADIFTSLSKLATETDQQVKNGSEMVDRLLKDIVTENATFDLVGFIPLLRERLYSKNSSSRQYIISWVSVLDAVPDIQLILFLPEILDGLFSMLSDPQVKSMCENVLSEFLRSINKDPSQVEFKEMINVLITHSQVSDETLQITSLTWMNDFIRLSGDQMLSHTSGILMSILPCLAYEGDNKKKIRDMASSVNVSLMDLIKPISASSSETDTKEYNNVVKDLDLPTVLEVLNKQVLHTHVHTKVASLKWIYHLQACIPDEMLNQFDVIFPTLLCALSDRSDDVVQHVITVLAQIISPKSQASDGERRPSPYFEKFLVSLFKQFREETPLLEDRGSFIIRQLCILLSAEDIYKTAAVILMNEEDLRFARVMIDTLNTILLTSSELYHLRTQLKNKENEVLFSCLYETWCHNPVATISLCLITQNYAHVCDLIDILANYEVTVEFLAEIDRLVQLIESPIFNYLRLELLQIPHNYFLIRSMYGFLMILPQSETFHTLRHRLECVPKLHFYYNARNSNSASSYSQSPEDGNKYKLNFDELKNHFIKIQELHREKRNEMHRLKGL